MRWLSPLPTRLSCRCHRHGQTNRQACFTLSLFLLDVDLGDATVLHAVKLTEGGGATETVAARGDAVVIEEVRLPLEVDGATVDGKRAWRLIGDAAFVVPRAVDALRC